MDPELVREYVNKKKTTVWGTFFLLLIISIEFNYLNCSLLYTFGYCELSFVFLTLAGVVFLIGLYFGHHPAKTGKKRVHKK